jgi:Uma2 family endonuclease
VRRPPDILVEVVSATPSDQRRDRIVKVEDYARFGAKQYWLLDPALRSLEVLELVDGKYAHTAAATSGTMTMPGCPDLHLDLDTLWRELDALPPEES